MMSSTRGRAAGVQDDWQEEGVENHTQTQSHTDKWENNSRNTRNEGEKQMDHDGE